MEDKSPDDHDGLTYDPSDEGTAPGSFRRRRILAKKEASDSEPPSLPPPRRKRRPTLSALSGFLSVLLLLSFGGLFGVIWGAKRLHEPGPLPADKVLYIAPGTDYPDIVAQLESENVIDNPLVFNIAVMAGGKRSKIKAGEYLFKQNASMRDVIEILVSGKQVLHSITIPEGLTSEQIVNRLQQNDVLLGEIRQMPKEGSLLPETYKVPRGMSRNEVIRRMQEDERKLVEQVWAHRAPDLILRSPYELVTLASIVEKETGKAEERPHVAAVFLNRLQKHIRLQSDPTIVYGLVGGKGTLGRPIQHAEVERPTPYNTYVIDGLPPGPITNPGRAALEAVANPMRSADLYFVADGTGGHVFSATLEQHSKNVQHWREIVKAAKEKANDGDVDRVVPLAPVMGPSLKPRRRSTDLDDGTTIFGELPDSLASADNSVVAPSLGIAAADVQFANLGSVPGNAAAPLKKPNAGTLNPAELKPDNTKVANLKLGSGIDGISISGVNDGGSASAMLDGPVDSNDSSAQNDDQAAHAASDAQPQPGGAAQQGANTSLNQQLAAAAANNNATTGAVLPQPMPQPEPQPQQTARPVHPAAFDASEGTALDPLRDKTYDLNYAKTVPSSTGLQ
ncbi:MAG: endolytic transglycosylase MltG [Methylovirgula sp.]|jgi:UPF0755 protein